MRRTIGIAAIVVLAAGAAFAQEAPDQTAGLQLELAQRMEQWTFWMMVTGAISSVAAALSLVALVWTFAAQRRLSQDTEAAVLVVVAGRIGLSSGMVPGIGLDIAVENRGRTQATDIELHAHFDITAGQGQPTKLLQVQSRKGVAFLASADVGVCFGMVNLLSDQCEGSLVEIKKGADGEYHATGTVRLRGKVTFRDFAGRRRDAAIPDVSFHLADGSKFDLRGPEPRLTKFGEF